MTAAARQLGRYELVRQLGAGGMGELYVARAAGIAGFAKVVALKRIIPTKASDERHIRMLLNEAKLVASLQHPNIAQVYDVGVEDGQYFFAMEYVHGQDLRHVLRRAPGRMLQIENCLHVAIGLCAGLHHAHEARDASGASLELVHRDVSPGNVLISYDGAIKLVDFGVAKASTMVSETRDGVVKGKYGYMSPEQCLGAPLDRRSDLFAVGILLWEMTLGRRLYKIRGELATLQRVVYVDAPRPSRYLPEYPAALEAIIMRALARDPNQRYATAQEMQVDLEAFAVQHKLAVSPLSMSSEMNELFKDRLDAWRVAERQGRSLADHLAESSSSSESESEDVVSDDELDGVIGDLHTNVFASDPQPPPFAPPPTEPARDTVLPRRKSRLFVTLAALVVAALAAIVVGYAVVDRREPQIASRADTGSAEQSAEQRGAPASVPVPVPVHDEDAAVNDIEAEVTVAPDAGEAEPPDVTSDGGQAVAEEPTTAAPAKHAKPRPSAKPKGHGATKSSTAVAASKPDDHASDSPSKPADDQETSTTEHATPPDAATVAKEKPRDVATPKPAVATGPAPGTVDANAVRAVVRAHLAEIQECVSRERMENRDLKGRVMMRIDLGANGGVISTSIASSTGATPGLEACMRKVVATWTFPAPAGGVRAAIRYPFAF